MLVSCLRNTFVHIQQMVHAQPEIFHHHEIILYIEKKNLHIQNRHNHKLRRRLKVKRPLTLIVRTAMIEENGMKH